MDTIIKDMNPVLQMLIVMTVFSLLPLVFCCMTSFLRFVIVFSMLKTAMGTQQVPPSVVIVGLAMILTFYTMGGTFQKMYEMGSVPYQKNHDMIAAIQEGSKPLKEFMLKQTRESDLNFFVEMAHKTKPQSPDEISIWEVAPAYIISELKTAFEIGFISMPFKLLIFIAVDGWALIVQGLVSSYN